MAIPTTPVLILRFPDGDVEHRTTRGELPVGALVRARGALWRVKSYRGPAATLEPADPSSDGAPGQPLVSPDAIGDTPKTDEIMSEV